jgi:O-antigen/teichoic acid export membrane protein
MKPNAMLKFLPAPLKAKLEGNTSLAKILNNTSWLLSESALRMAINLVVGIWLARYLGPTEFGNYNYALSVIALLGPISALGLNAIVTREIVRNPDSESSILGTAFILRVLASVICLGLIVGGCGLLQTSASPMTLFLILLAVGNLFSGFQVVDFWFQAHVASQYVVMSRTVTLILGTIAKLVLIAMQAPLVAFIVVAALEIVSMSVNLAIAYQTQQRNLLNWRFDLTQAKLLLAQSWPLIISSLGAAINLKIDQVMLGELSTPAAVGIYAVAVRLSEVFYFIPEALAASIFPSLLKSKQEGATVYQAKLQKLYNVLACCGILIAVPISLIAVPLLTTLYGEAYSQSGVILSIHIWAGVFIFMRSALSKWLVAEDLFIFSFVTHGSGAIMNVLLNLFLIPRYQGVGAAISTVISYATSSYFALFLNKKTIISGKMMTLALVSPLRFVLKWVS